MKQTVSRAGQHRARERLKILYTFMIAHMRFYTLRLVESILRYLDGTEQSQQASLALSRSILQELETDAQAAPVKAPAPGTVAMKQVFRTTPPPLMVARNSYADASLFFSPGHREAAYIRATRWVDHDHSCFAEVNKDQVLQEALAMLNREPSAEGSLSRTGRVTRTANRGTCRPGYGAGHV
jgi:hypothetical protein